ncbi:hypothetical protein CGC20_38410 [Leishmania donovani]|uniref:Uncharacterized protein n=1 Tax=Leishmania donovani TaxID=5661 RepID=A0A504XXV2_LEIDO|nr:hypothetical protein CGC20_38410 [Leishmania donovani]
MSAAAADYPLRRRGDVEDDFDEEEHRRLTESSINAFLEEEGVPVSSSVTVEDITSALVALGNSVATAAASFVVKVALLRLDCLAAVEGELRKDVACASSSKVRVTADKSPPRRSSRASAFGWLRHLYKEEKGVCGFLRGGQAEFGFVLASFVEEALLFAAMRSLMDRLGSLLPSQSSRAGGAAALWWAGLSRTVAPTFAMSLLSWPLRAVWGCVLHRMGARSLLLNGLDVDLASRALSLGLAWTVVKPASRWMQRWAMMSTSNAGGASAPLTLVRLGQHRLFALGVLLAVAGSVNALQRPFVVLRQRMALLPVADAESACNGGDDQTKTPPTARRGCRYANGWDCAVQVWRQEGVAGLLAGLQLCLITSSVVPLLQTLAGYPTAPSFSGAEPDQPTPCGAVQPAAMPRHTAQGGPCITLGITTSKLKPKDSMCKRVLAESSTRIVVSSHKPDHHCKSLRHSASPDPPADTKNPQSHPRLGGADLWHPHEELALGPEMPR